MSTRQIYKFMSVCTQTVGREKSMSVAHALMREHHVRHLPVVDGGVLVGILSDGDLRFAEALRDIDTSRVRVEEVMTKEPYFVAPSASLGEVAAHMAEHRYGCAVVMDGAKIAGIFTSTDALRALATVVDDEAPSRRPVGSHV